MVETYMPLIEIVGRNKEEMRLEWTEHERAVEML
jgi:hypothetical protein